MAENPLALKLFQRAIYKELTVGAGATLFRANTAGVFAGATNYSSAPFRISYAGALYATTGTIAGNFSITGTLQFKVGSTLKATIAADSSSSLIFTTNNNVMFFDDNSHYIGKLFYASASSYGLELAGGGKIQFTGGSVLIDEGNKLTLDRVFETLGSTADIVSARDVVANAGGNFKHGNDTGAYEESINYKDHDGNNKVALVRGGIVTDVDA